MGLMNWLRGEQPIPAPEQRIYGGGAWLPPGAIPRPGTESGPAYAPTQSAAQALGISAVWACVNLITNAVASLPFDAFRRKAGVPVALEPRPPVLERPHPDLRAIDWHTQVMTSLLLRGNAYLLIVGRDGAGYPSALLPLSPDECVPQIDIAGPVDRVAHYSLRNAEIPVDAIVHIRGLTLPGRALGLSVLEHARVTLGLSRSADDFGFRYFAEGTNPTGVLETDEDLDPEDADDVLAGWEARHSAGSRRPAILTSGLKWNQISITPEDSQFLGTREFQAADVARLFGVPPHMIGAVDKTTSWGSGIEQQAQGFATYTLRPWLVRVESALSDQLPRGQYVQANLDGLLRGTTSERYAAYKIALESKFLGVNEVRALEGRPPAPGGELDLTPPPPPAPPAEPPGDPATSEPEGGDE